jgi:DNA processing protein
LYYRGDVSLLQKQILAVVGSRLCSSYGIKVTKYLVEPLLPYFIICSGLARGIDTVAHETCIANNYPTIAVVATGLETIYPSQNKALGQKIIEKGIIVSEYPIGTDAIPYRFPQRNRIISGLAKGVVVTEAAKQSGALITARLAGEQGKDVFAVPGNIFLDETIGTNHLIQDGAKLVNSYEDILSEYMHIELLKEDNLHKSSSIDLDFDNRSDLSQTEIFILKNLQTNPMALDDIVKNSTYTVSEILENISRLELKNLIQEIKPNKYKIS